MRGGDFFIHVETIRENTPKGWIMNPNYSEILRFHDFGDMLLKINTVLSYLENSRAGTAELPEFHSLQDSGFAQRLMVVLTVVPIAIMAVGVGVWIKRRNS